MLKLTMCRKLSELLDAPEPAFQETIRRLELSSGEPHVDIRITSEIAAKVRMGLRQLGLDQDDTSGPELYGALLQLVGLHDAFLARRLGGKDPSDVVDMLPRIKKIVGQMRIAKHAWVIKQSVAKRLLMETPPKKLMKLLKHRSIDSMVKRENIAEIFTAIRFVESEAWQRTFTDKLKKLTPSDFEVRDIEIIILDTKRWSNSFTNHLKLKGHNIVHSKEMGVILMTPLPVKKLSGLTIITLPTVIHYLNEIRLYSAYLKMQQVKANFGKILIDTLLNDPKNHVAVAGVDLHWRIVHRHFGSQSQNVPEVFEPHVQTEDMRWRKAEEILYLLEPALKFWHQSDFVATTQDKKPISFNLIDVAVSYINKLPYEKRVFNNFRTSLWNELMQRYVAQQSLESSVLRQLDGDTLDSNLIMIGDL